jgi:HD superfamily phosphohydrolase
LPSNTAKLVYDCVHGYIELTAQELKIVDTIVFQRLHNIRQLGTSFLVYPGATHSRFAHSLGTLCVMGKLAQRLKELGIIEDEEGIAKLRLAALLHDIGHYPFSHVLEIPTKKLNANGDGDHEQLSAHLIHNSCLKDSLDTFTPDDISSIITKKVVDKPFYSLLISSDLDVDRIDYLMRDAHATGVSYGFIDLQRLIRTITFDAEDHLAVEAKGRQALENFLMARYHMYQTVYYHKTVVCFDLMLQQIYEDLIQNEIAYSYEDICKLSDEEIYNFNDSYVWNLIQENQGKPELLGELISRFQRRQRLKMIKEVHGISVSGRQEPDYSKLSLIQNPIHLDGLSKESSVPKDWIFYSLPKPLEILSNVDEEGAVHVLNEDGSSNPIAKDPHSIVSMLYDSCSLSARVYTKDEYASSLLKGIQECFELN